MSNIVDSTSLRQFVAGRRIQVAPCVNKESGETFKSIAITNADTTIQWVHFSSKLGELSAKEVGRRADDLQVVHMSSGTYILCNKGESSWEDVII